MASPGKPSSPAGPTNHVSHSSSVTSITQRSPHADSVPDISHAEAETVSGIFSVFSPAIPPAPPPPKSNAKNVVDMLECWSPDHLLHSSGRELMSPQFGPRSVSFGEFKHTTRDSRDSVPNCPTSPPPSRILLRLCDLSPAVFAQIPVVMGVATYVLRGGHEEQVKVNVPAEDVVLELRTRVRELEIRVKDAEAESAKSKIQLRAFEQQGVLSGQKEPVVDDLRALSELEEQVQARAQSIIQRRADLVSRMNSYSDRKDLDKRESSSMRDLRSLRAEKEDADRHSRKSKRQTSQRYATGNRVRHLFGARKRDGHGYKVIRESSMKTPVVDNGRRPSDVKRMPGLPVSSSTILKRPSNREAPLGTSHDISKQWESTEWVVENGKDDRSNRLQSTQKYSPSNSNPIGNNASTETAKTKNGRSQEPRNHPSMDGTVKKQYSFSSLLDGRKFKTR